MEKWFNDLIPWAAKGVIGFVVLIGIKWISNKFKKIDDTEKVKAELHNHKKEFSDFKNNDYKEFKEETKGDIAKLEERIYNQKQ